MEPASRLTLFWDFDEPDYGELTCLAAHNEFSGVAQMWVGRAELLALASALELYPLNPLRLPSLEAGYDGQEPSISVVFKPTGLMGQLTAFVGLVANFEPRQEARLAIPVEYAALPRFAASIRLMLAAGSGEADLFQPG